MLSGAVDSVHALVPLHSLLGLLNKLDPGSAANLQISGKAYIRLAAGYRLSYIYSDRASDFGRCEDGKRLRAGLIRTN